MTIFPPSPFLSAEPACGDYSQSSQHHNGDLQPGPAETAAALVTSPQAAAAELIPDPPSNEGRHQGAPATDPNPFDAGATDHIHEIFHYARKLCDEGHRS